MHHIRVSEDISTAISRFEDNPFMKENLTKQDIRETLLIVNLTEDAATSQTEVIHKAVSLVKKDTDLWRRTLYYGCIDGKSFSFVAFYCDDCYVDVFGNVFLTENDFLQAMRYFGGYVNIKSHDGWNYNREKLPSDAEVIDILVQSLQKYGKATAILGFMADSYITTVGDALKKIESFFLFFWLINDKIAASDKSATYVATPDGFHILFSNLRYFVIKYNEHKDYEKMLNGINLGKYTIQIPFDECMLHLGFPDYKKTSDFEILQNDISERYGFRKNDCYRNLCIFTAIKIFKYIFLNSNITCNSISAFKSIVFWADAKFDVDGFDEPYEVAKKQFDKNEVGIKNNFCELLHLARTKQSTNHQFSQCFTAAYHFQEHYNEIADTLRSKFNENYPLLTDENFEECIKLYLIDLPEKIFSSGCFDYAKDKKPSKLKIQLRQNFHFFRYDDFIHGIKYTFVDPPEIKYDCQGSVEENSADLAGSKISTIFYEEQD